MPSLSWAGIRMLPAGVGLVTRSGTSSPQRTETRGEPSPWRTQVRTPVEASSSSTWSTTEGWTRNIRCSVGSWAGWRSSTRSAARPRTRTTGRRPRSQSGRRACFRKRESLQPPELSRQPERAEMRHELIFSGSNVLDPQLVFVDGHTERMRLFDGERGPRGSLGRHPPFLQVRFGGEEHHVIRAREHNVVPPLRRGKREVDHGPCRRGARFPASELDRNWFGAMMATAFDSDDLVQHRVERDGVPGAVRIVTPTDDGTSDAKRRGDGREREGHEDPLGAGHEFQVACLLEPFQGRKRLVAREMVPFHDLFEDRRNRLLHELVEDKLPHVASERIGRGARHDGTSTGDGVEEGDKPEGFCHRNRKGENHFVAKTK